MNFTKTNTLISDQTLDIKSGSAKGRNVVIKIKFVYQATNKNIVSSIIYNERQNSNAHTTECSLSAILEDCDGNKLCSTLILISFLASNVSLFPSILKSSSCWKILFGFLVAKDVSLLHA